MFFHCRYDSPLGEMTLLCDESALLGAWFEGQKYFAAGFPSLGEENRGAAPLLAAASWLDAYYGGAEPDPFAVPLNDGGSAFALAVRDALRAVPYGQTTTYGAIAGVLSERLGRKVAARAVGGAVARNPISVIVPCHRVLGADGALTGYAGGMGRKIALLKLEGVMIPMF